MDITSGEGKSAVVPPELRGWNWGAFFLSWICGIANKTYISFIWFVPILGWIIIFFLGAKGNKWAWQNRHWNSIEHFRSVQKKWAIWGLIVWILSSPLVVLLILIIYTEASALAPFLFTLF